MKLFVLFFSTFFYLFSSLTIAAETKIYHWVDEEGKMHFSDSAIPGTKQVNVKENNLLLSLPQESKQQEAPQQQPDEPVTTYKATITSPEDDKPLRSNNGTINIHVQTEPEKENTQKLQLYLDGIKLGSPQISQTIRALNIDRGTHQVQVELLDEDGTSITKTQIVTVHLMRASQ